MASQCGYLRQSKHLINTSHNTVLYAGKYALQMKRTVDTRNWPVEKQMLKEKMKEYLMIPFTLGIHFEFPTIIPSPGIFGSMQKSGRLLI